MIILLFFCFLKEGLEDIHVAAATGNAHVVLQLLQAQPALANRTDFVGRSPLVWAVLGDHLDILAMLIQAGADINGLPFLFSQYASQGHRQQSIFSARDGGRCFTWIFVCLHLTVSVIAYICRVGWRQAIRCALGGLLWPNSCFAGRTWPSVRKREKGRKGGSLR
jgi:hypothetical protein